LSGSRTETKALPTGGALMPPASCAREGGVEAAAHAHHLTGGAHLRPEDRVDALELGEREDRFLHRVVVRHDFLGRALLGQRLAGHAARGDLGQRHAGGLGHERHGARGTRVHFQQVDGVGTSSLVWIANWVFIRPTTFRALASSTTWRRSSAWVSADSEYGGSEQDESPECTPASSMCSITPPIRTLPSVGDDVDVALDGVVEEAVQQHRRIVGHLHRVAHVAGQVGFAVDDFHRAAAQHVARAHHQRVADLAGQQQGFLVVAGGAVRRLLQAQLVDQLLEALAVFGQVDRVGLVPMTGTPLASSARQLQRVWPPYCTITPFGCSSSTISSTSSSVSGSKYRRSEVS
jgi:hypothetical protein